MRNPVRLGVAPLVAGALLSGTAFASGVTASFDREFSLSAYTTFTASPVVASDASGDFVVTFLQGGNVEARRFSADGTPEGAQFRVNTTDPGAYTFGYPSVGRGTSGEFVIAWHWAGPALSGATVRARRFSASGAPLGNDFQVGASTGTLQSYPSVGVDGFGNFVIAWQDIGLEGLAADFGFGIYARRYDSSGAANGSAFHVNTYSTNQQRHPSVAVVPNGDFIIAWQSVNEDGSGEGIYAQRYAANGSTRGGEGKVNANTVNDQIKPKTAANASGDYVVVWQASLYDGSLSGVAARRFAATGSALSDEFQVNTLTTGNQYLPSVSFSGGGGFVVTWESSFGDGNAFGIEGQRYDAAGAAAGPEFTVNTYTSGGEYSPSVAGAPGGGFTVTWVSPISGRAQMFRDMARPGDVNGDGTTDVSDVFYLINYLFAGGPAPK